MDRQTPHSHGRWRSLLQFRLRTLLAAIVLLCIFGGALLAWWRTPFETERRVSATAWAHADKVFAEEERQFRRRRRESLLMQLYLDRKNAPEFPYREIAAVYLDVFGNQVKHGELTVWDLQGHKLRSENWIHGKLHGPWTDYYPTGEKLASGQFVEGKPHGQWMTFFKYDPERYELEQYDRGTLMRREFRNNSGGETHRKLQLFENGLLANETSWRNDFMFSERQYRAGQQHGASTWYYQNGRRQSLMHYDNDLRHGPVTVWYESGKKRSEGRFAANLETGHWIWRNAEGEVEREADFENGRLIGPSGNLLPPIIPANSASFRHTRSVVAALDDLTSAKLRAQPLSYAMLYLADRHTLLIDSDDRAMSLAGLPPADEIQINCELENLTLRAALQLLLAPHGLSTVIRHDVLLITTIEDAKSWRDRSGISEILASPTSGIAPKLHESTDLDFLNTPLPEALQFLQEMNQIDIKVDQAAFDAADRDSAIPMTCQRFGVSLAGALSFLLDQHELTCVEQNGELLIRPLPNEGASSPPTAKP